MLSAFFLLYGLVFYTNPLSKVRMGGISKYLYFRRLYFYAGIFMIQYGQQFLMLELSQFLTFFLSSEVGIEALGKR